MKHRHDTDARSSLHQIEHHSRRVYPVRNVSARLFKCPPHPWLVGDVRPERNPVAMVPVVEALCAVRRVGDCDGTPDRDITQLRPLRRKSDVGVAVCQVDGGFGCLEANAKSILRRPKVPQASRREAGQRAVREKPDDWHRVHHLPPVDDVLRCLMHRPHAAQQCLPVRLRARNLSARTNNARPVARSSASIRRPMVGALMPVFSAAPASPPCSATCKNRRRSSQFSTFIRERCLSFVRLQLHALENHLPGNATSLEKRDAASMDDSI
ncbi:hypothetical protein AB7M37_005431 [Sinorhizobium fredii]